MRGFANSVEAKCTTTLVTDAHLGRSCGDWTHVSRAEWETVLPTIVVLKEVYSNVWIDLSIPRRPYWSNSWP